MDKVLTGFEAQKLIKNYVSIPKSQLVKNLHEIKLELPLVLKIVSKDAIHKTEIKGVRIVKHKQDLSYEFNDLIKVSKDKRLKLDGILVQEFVEGEQLIIGIKKDPVFNHVILFGLGGIFTEILEDISIRKCPISYHDAKEMIEELKSSKLFHGFRGINLNTKFLEKTLVDLSKIPLKYKNIQELDINPFILNSKTGKCVDTRIVFN